MGQHVYSGVKYLGGIPSYPKGAGCKVVIDENGVGLFRWGACRAQIQLADLHDVTVLPYLSAFPPASHDKSVLGRAAVGGLLLGPIGALVGGMSGVGSKQKLTLTQSVHKSDFVLLLEGTEHGIRFRCAFVFPSLFLKQRAAAKPMEQIQCLRAQAAKARCLIAEPVPRENKPEAPPP